MGLAIDLHIHLIEGPSPLRDLVKLLRPALPDFAGKQRSEPVPAASHRLVAGLDRPFMEKVFDVPKR
jgi:hypothetical protein